jgi:hypothetical protein
MGLDVLGERAWIGPVMGWAWWVASCGATTAGEGVEGAPLHFNRRVKLGWRAAKGSELRGTAGLRETGLKVAMGRKGGKKMKKQMNFFLVLEFIFGKRII